MGLIKITSFGGKRDGVMPGQGRCIECRRHEDLPEPVKGFQSLCRLVIVERHVDRDRFVKAERGLDSKGKNVTSVMLGPGKCADGPNRYQLCRAVNYRAGYCRERRGKVFRLWMNIIIRSIVRSLVVSYIETEYRVGCDPGHMSSEQ